MGKFNTVSTAAERLHNHPDATTNYGGGLAFRTDKKTELFLRVASCLVGESKYYTGPKDDEIIRLVGEVTAEDPRFVPKLAIYARNELHLRSVATMLMVEWANVRNPSYGVPRKTVSRIIRRPDDITEMIALQLARNRQHPRKGKLPMFLKNGLAQSWQGFTAYHLAKYAHKPGDVSLRDALFLTHPKPFTAQQQDVFDDLARDTLEPPATWESVISKKGSTKEAWESVLPSMGYMALLRNLRNLLKAGVPVDQFMPRITDEKAILNSKQLPFRFYSAYRTISSLGMGDVKEYEHLPVVLAGLEQAIQTSTRNLPKLKGTTVVAVDLSGSMNTMISARSPVTYKDIGCLFGAMATRISESAIIIGFGSTAASVPLLPGAGILENMRRIRDMSVGFATNAHLVPGMLARFGKTADRVILFSDMQCYTQWTVCDEFAPAFQRYRNKYAPGCYLYSVDLAGHGTIQVPQDERNTALVAGWSDNVLAYISLFEQDRRSQVADVERTVL